MNNKVFLIKNACPLCGGDVKGNDELGYYCKRCNLIFSFDELRGNSKKTSDRRNEKQHETTQSIKNAGNHSISNVNSNPKCEPEESMLFVASRMSNKFHTPNCPFAKNILPENKVVFKSKEEALSHGFKPCKCVD